jgi:predicted ATP-grasp superfamily ATP-dependent carboligase
MNMIAQFKVGDRVRLFGRRNYKTVRIARRLDTEGRPWEYMLAGMKGYIEESDVEFFIPAGTGGPIAATSYVPKSDPQAQISGVLGLQSAIEWSHAEMAQLRKQAAEQQGHIKILSSNIEHYRKQEGEQHMRICNLVDESSKQIDKLSRLQRIVTAFIEGRL